MSRRSLMGWCNDGFHHDHPKNPCKGAVKHVMGVHAGETRLCGCTCHGFPDEPEPEVDETPDEEHEEQHEATPEPRAKVTGPETYYTAVRGDDGKWLVVDPDGNPAKISGQSAWSTEATVEVALGNANRRKVAREWAARRSA